MTKSSGEGHKGNRILKSFRWRNSTAGAVSKVALLLVIVPLLTRTWSQGSAGSSSSSSTTTPSPKIPGKILGDLRGKWRTRRQEWLQNSPQTSAKFPRKSIPIEGIKLRKPSPDQSPRSSPVPSHRDSLSSEVRTTKNKTGKLRSVVDSVRLLNCSSATANFPSSHFSCPYGDPVNLVGASGKKAATRESSQEAKGRSLKKRLEMWKGGTRRRSNSESQLSELISREQLMQTHELVPLENIKISGDIAQCSHSVFMAKSHGKPLTLVVMDTSKEANQSSQSKSRDSDFKPDETGKVYSGRTP